jgi:hypothetical protein
MEEHWVLLTSLPLGKQHRYLGALEEFVQLLPESSEILIHTPERGGVTLPGGVKEFSCPPKFITALRKWFIKWTTQIWHHRQDDIESLVLYALTGDDDRAPKYDEKTETNDSKKRKAAQLEAEKQYNTYLSKNIFPTVNVSNPSTWGGRGHATILCYLLHLDVIVGRPEARQHRQEQKEGTKSSTETLSACGWHYECPVGGVMGTDEYLSETLELRHLRNQPALLFAQVNTANPYQKVDHHNHWGLLYPTDDSPELRRHFIYPCIAKLKVSPNGTQ